MPRECVVCTHKYANQINAEVVSKLKSGAAIAREFGISVDAMRRHIRNHITPAVEAVVAQALAKPDDPPVELPDKAPAAMTAFTFDLAQGMARAHRVLDRTVGVGEELLDEAEKGEDRAEKAQYADFASRQADRSLRGIHGTVGAKAVAMIADNVKSDIESSREERLLAFLLDEEEADE
jgi:hypothetical protein